MVKTLFICWACLVALSVSSPREFIAVAHADASGEPRFIIYYNSKSTPLSDAAKSDYSHVIVSFLGAQVNTDDELELILPKNMEGQWGAITLLQEQGKKVLISYGGGLAKAEDYQVLIGREAELAELLAGFVRKHRLDGIDIDFEASSMLHEKRAAGVADGKAFLITLSKALRQQLPAGQYSLSHAPQSPYLNREWHGGPYLTVLKEVGEQIDWITVQYYNNPGQDGPVKDKVIGTKAAPYATSYRGLSSTSGDLAWSPAKLVIGKPVYKADAFSGHVSPENIIEDIIKPMVAQYGDQFGGIAGWQYSIHTKDHQQWNEDLGKALYPVND